MDIKYKCDKCGSEPPIDKEKSNDKWIVYRIKEPCKCGGKFVIDFGNK